MRLWTLIKKDGLVIFRSPLLVIVLLLYPLVIVGLLGYAFSEPSNTIPLAIVNLDVDENGDPNEAQITNPFSDTQQVSAIISSRQIVEDLEAVARVHHHQSNETALQELLRGEVQAVVILSAGFVNQLVEFGQGSARLVIVVDQSDPVRAGVMENAIRGIVQFFQEQIIAEKVEIVVGALEHSLQEVLPRNDFAYPGFAAAIRHLESIRDSGNLSAEQVSRINEVIQFLQNIRSGVESSIEIVRSVAQPIFVEIAQEESGHLFVRDLVVPAALGLGIFWTGSLATAALIVYERESPAYQRLGVTPVSRASIILSKVYLTLFVILVQGGLILLSAVAFFGTRVDNLPLTFLLVFLSAFASVGIGIFLSGVTKDVNAAVLLSVLATFPMLFMSGLFFPVDFMPAGAQALAGLFPLTYTISGLRGAMLRGFEFGDALPEITALLLSGIILAGLGLFFGWRNERK